MMHIGNEDSRHTNRLEGLVLVNIDYFKDERGFFIESWNKKSFTEAGIPDDFVQDSHSGSGYGVLRGMHYQDMSAPIAKLVRCTVGRIFDVAVDLECLPQRLGMVQCGTECGKQVSPVCTCGVCARVRDAG